SNLLAVVITEDLDAAHQERQRAQRRQQSPHYVAAFPSGSLDRPRLTYAGAVTAVWILPAAARHRGRSTGASPCPTARRPQTVSADVEVGVAVERAPVAHQAVGVCRGRLREPGPPAPSS